MSQREQMKKEIIETLRKQKGEGFSLELALFRQNGEWKNCFSMLTFVQKKIEETKLVYGDFVLERKFLTFNDGLAIINNVFDNELLEIPEYGDFGRVILRSGRVEFIPSKRQYYYLYPEWPTRYITFQVEDKRKAYLPGEVLSKREIPLYPNGVEALRDFFKLNIPERYHFGEQGTFAIVVSDYRAKIKEMKIALTKIRVAVEAPHISKDKLAIKIFSKSGPKSIQSPDLFLEDETVEFDLEFQPDEVLAYLLEDDSKIDFKEYMKWRMREEGVTFERPEEEIKDLIRGGEGPKIEFKVDLEREHKDEFLETVIAFSNTNGGLIMLGINDNGQIKGYKGDEDSILKMIHDNCEPSIEPQFKRYTIDSFPILIVEIQLGNNKPYLLKSRGVAYVRHGSNDFPANRLELDQMYESKKTTSPYGVYG